MKEHSGPSDAAADTDLLRRALGTFATGVTVVTVGGETPHAMTANSFTSVSLDPPLVLVCVEHSAVMHSSLLARGTFGVSVLAAHQEPVARQFASRLRPLGLAQFDAVDWRPGRLTGAPLIEGALAHLECGLWRSYDGGDHTIFVGTLLSVEKQADSDAVVFFRGRFRQLSPDLPAQR
ncbi:flavin reductase (DIM6/NTAB) family NADH-FMN oxidoreductase RutF [Allocatelliglobosispora scoriae]|uniref:Flavin reductase (DIM6/NTAB) family NADH-FMN oxidoreductase RutF n=1 Tax=Allocatelliglobosispora scoriae TaxID=643052 RepID=A0A841BLW8_9ACTN|nr:flavin reductase family protein [Allocatelliglobosispora scoriae]MBB5870077.1 flavin reductase (DIM6/NTAB) family NADH-FMN oxidoreductase RutF [Allocatelliglobosispora scoriae]